MTKKNKAKLLPYLPQMKIGIRVLLGLIALSVACFVGRCNSQTPPCPDGWIEFEGHCAAMPQPEHDTVKEFEPSKEKPSRHPEPAYERGEVHADAGIPTMQRDIEEDQAAAQGKKAAGLQ